MNYRNSILKIGWDLGVIEMRIMFTFLFFFNVTATTEIYTLSLHDALPISSPASLTCELESLNCSRFFMRHSRSRSEEHTSELQSLRHLVCRLLLEKKK